MLEADSTLCALWAVKGLWTSCKGGHLSGMGAVGPIYHSNHTVEEIESNTQINKYMVVYKKREKLHLIIFFVKMIGNSFVKVA